MGFVANTLFIEVGPNHGHCSVLVGVAYKSTVVFDRFLMAALDGGVNALEQGCFGLSHVQSIRPTFLPILGQISAGVGKGQIPFQIADVLTTRKSI